jgi:hypothetical protein
MSTQIKKSPGTTALIIGGQAWLVGKSCVLTCRMGSIWLVQVGNMPAFVDAANLMPLIGVPPSNACAMAEMILA